MRQHFLLLVFYVCSFLNVVYSQTDKHIQYNTYFLNGEYAMKNKDYLEAIVYYDSASFVFPHFHKPYFHVVFCASQLNDYEKAYQSAVKMILTGVHLDAIPQENMGEFCNTDYYKQLKRQDDFLYQTGMQMRDTLFANAVLQLCKKHQSTGVRKDTATFHEFVALCIKKAAFPSCLNVGTEAYRNAFVLLYNSLWHSNYPDSEDWQKLLKLMRNEFLSNGIESYWIAQFEDIYCSNNNIPLRYSILFNDFKQNNIYPTIEELNNNRKKAGLPPIELEAKILNIDLYNLLNK